MAASFQLGSPETVQKEGFLIARGDTCSLSLSVI